MKRLLAFSTLAFLAACGETDQDARENLTQSTREANAVVKEARALLPPADLSAADRGRVCRAIIASLNGRDPAIINVISSDGDLYRVRYTRDDGTVWTNECRVGNGTAEWRIVENGQPGRWRTEDTIRFTVSGSTVSVQTFMGADPMTSDTYEIE